MAPPQAQTLANLGNISVMGQANLGGNDAVVFSTGSTLYAVQISDSVLVLGTGWTAVEYNLVGDCCGSAATINNGASMVVRVGVDNGSPSAPVCASASFSGYTAETNSLNFDNPPPAVLGTTPAIMFKRDSSGNAAPCSSATFVASGALVDSHDFNADGVSDIAWRNSGNGQLAMWLMSNGHMSSGATISQVASTWSVVGTRDFNGDGHADLSGWTTPVTSAFGR